MGWGSNVQSTSGRNISSLTYTSYAVPAGDNKILAVGVGIEEAGTLPTVSSVTHNAVGLTARVQHTGAHDVNQRNELWDLQLGSTTPTGDIVVTISAAADDLRLIANTGTGLAQQAPEATQTGTSENTATITTTITTVTDDAEILDQVTNEKNTGTIFGTETNQNDVGILADRGYSGVSERTAGAAGNHTMGWDHSSLNTIDWIHVVAAYEAAAATGGLEILRRRREIIGAF